METGRGDAAAASSIVRGSGSRRRRRASVGRPWTQVAGAGALVLAGIVEAETAIATAGAVGAVLGTVVTSIAADAAPRKAEAAQDGDSDA